MFRSNPEALHGILEFVRTGRLNEHLHQENRTKGGYIWVLLVSTLGMIAINTGVIFGARGRGSLRRPKKGKPN